MHRWLCRSLWRLVRGSDVTLRQKAIPTLGSVAMQLQKADAGAANALVDELSRGLGAAQGAETQELWLLALGNSRNPRAFTSLQTFLTATSPKLRSAATGGLRFMPAPEADRLLSERLLLDDAPEVRRAAVFAAGYRPLDPLLPAIERALRSDPIASVRNALVQFLKGHVSTSSKARLLLTEVREQDPDGSIRREAARALESPLSPR